MSDAPEKKTPKGRTPAQSKSTDWTAFERPVSQNFLAKVFKRDRMTVKKRLADLEPVGMDRGNPTYDFLAAAELLIAPKVNLEEHIRGMRAQDLPPALNASFWKAQIDKQRWEYNASHLWHAEDIEYALDGLFRTIRVSLVGAADNMIRAGHYDDAEVKHIRAAFEEIQTRVYEKILDIKEHGHTASSADISAEDLEDD